MTDGTKSRPLSSRENENFVKDYFAQSRLHFIGFFRARYENLIAAVAAKLGKDVSGLVHQAPRKERNLRKDALVAHVDLDCFFANVARVKNPGLAGKPVAVCHSSNNGGSFGDNRGGEISSASYEARKYGVKAGMLFRRAQRLCPELIAVPYDFKLYEDVSVHLYTLFYKIPGVVVEAVSVDEAYLDLTDSVTNRTEADDIIRQLRDDVYAETGCTASAGIGANKLVARLATKRAKPNGQLTVQADNCSRFISTMDLDDIPGIGWRTRKNLDQLAIRNIAQLQGADLLLLRKHFGDTQGKIFYDAVRGIDHRRVEPLKPRRSIGADCGWGVRFENNEDSKVKKFISDMADEVVERLRTAGASGSRVTYKVLRKQKNAGTAYKFLGHGPCDMYSRTADFSSLSDLASVCLRLHLEIGCPNNEFRGIGVKVNDISFRTLRNKRTANRSRAIERYFKINDQPIETRAPNESTTRRNMVQASKVHLVDDTVRGRDQTSENEACFLGSSSGVKHDVSLPDDWDRDVLHELPKTVREELINMNELNSQRARKGLTLSSGIKKGKARKPQASTLTKMLQKLRRPTQKAREKGSG